MLPTLFFRNTWSWGRSSEGYFPKPRIARAGDCFLAEHASLGTYRFALEAPAPLLFTENETNFERLYGSQIGANAGGKELEEAFGLIQAGKAQGAEILESHAFG